MADWASTTYQNILASMADGVMTLDPEGRITTFNPAAENLLGLRAGDVLGRPFGQAFIVQEDWDALSDLVLGAVFEARATRSATVDITVAGERRTLLVNTTFLPRDAEAPGVVVVMSDMTEARRRLHAERLFGQYVDSRVVERLLALEDGAESLRERREMTIMFTDLVGYTRIAERLDVAVLVDFLNVYFEAVTRPVQRNGGLVDKFIGDSVMSLWGGPFDAAADPPCRACRAALEQRTAMEGVREWARRSGLAIGDPQRIDVRVGISTGPVVVGSFGPAGNRSFTVLGDAVNVAARLEKTGKDYGVGIVAAAATRAAAGHHFRFRALETKQLQGRDRPEAIFELLAEAPAGSGAGSGARDLERKPARRRAVRSARDP